MLAFILAHAGLFSGGGAAVLFGGIAAALRLFGPTVLLAHWKAFLAILVVVVALVAIGALYVLFERSKADLAASQRDYATLNGNYQTTLAENRQLSASNANLGTVIETQSRSIDTIAAQARTAKAAADAALAAAISKQQTDQQAIARLTARIADPASKQGTCDEEINAIRGAL